MRDEGVGAVEELLGFGVNFLADAEDIGVDWGIPHSALRRDIGDEKEEGIYLIADFAWEVKECEERRGKLFS